MEHLERLYEMKRDLMNDYNNYVKRSVITPMGTTPPQLQIIREEIEHLSHRIEHEKDISLNDAFITNRLYDVVNENPEEYLDMMNIKDIERYLRKKKLDNLK